MTEKAVYKFCEQCKEPVWNVYNNGRWECPEHPEEPKKINLVVRVK